MTILDVIMQAQDGAATRQLGQNFGLDPTQTQSALGALLPSLAGAVKQNASASGGLETLQYVLTKGNHQRYLNDPSTLSAPDTVADGNGVLKHLLGSKDVSLKLAANASAQTGIDADVLKKMLPVVAGMMMGGLSKQWTRQGGLLGTAVSMQRASGLGGSGLGDGDLGGGSAAAQSGGGLLDMLTPMLDQNKDGSALDDVLRMASSFLKK